MQQPKQMLYSFDSVDRLNGRCCQNRCFLRTWVRQTEREARCITEYRCGSATAVRLRITWKSHDRAKTLDSLLPPLPRCFQLLCLQRKLLCSAFQYENPQRPKRRSPQQIVPTSGSVCGCPVEMKPLRDRPSWKEMRDQTEKDKTFSRRGPNPKPACRRTCTPFPCL